VHSCPITELFLDEWVNLVFRRVSESCLTQFQVSGFTATSMREQATLRWDDDASFVLDQHADLDFDSEPAHWNNSSYIYMCTLPSLLANQTLLTP
jgi:hypothetical protein